MEGQVEETGEQSPKQVAPVTRPSHVYGAGIVPGLHQLHPSQPPLWRLRALGSPRFNSKVLGRGITKSSAQYVSDIYESVISSVMYSSR